MAESARKQTTQLIQGDDARHDPVRLLVVQEDARPAIDLHDEDTVMTFPHLLVRELIALLAASLLLVVVSLLFDAPLEELANPEVTPNPAKAPWYFLGLQELLHYYPPLVSGVILPGLVVAALVVVPYFPINLKRTSLFEGRDVGRVVVTLVAVGVGLTALFYFTGAHPVWPIIGPTWFVIGLMASPAALPEGPGRRWLTTRSVPFWVFFWFLVVAVVLTVVGVFFRGPGWAFTLPWVEGIYY
ncbi:MAG: hypothetical protein KC731_31490 [Myxococcales bacterium]|nr:hypothetical protein [Myxococcales bacterium]